LVVESTKADNDPTGVEKKKCEISKETSAIERALKKGAIQGRISLTDEERENYPKRQYFSLSRQVEGSLLPPLRSVVSLGSLYKVAKTSCNWP
jgi:hypothetical protein